MKHYDEKAMASIRSTFESKVLPWSGVRPKEMMGCLCYFHGKRFFAFLVTGGVVITKLPEAGREELTRKHRGKPFEMAGRTAKTWVQVPVKKPGDLSALMPFVKTSYDIAVKG